MYFLIILIYVSLSIITYDSNLNNQMEGSGFFCKSATYTYSITFSDVFASIPKVVIISEMFDLDKSIDYQFQITSVTIAGFSIEINCLSSDARVFGYLFKWFATDDPKIEVINCFNNINPTLTQTFSHSNPNALYGFVSLLSFKVIGDTYFNITITSITPTTVITSISDQTNLLQIGYQIILGVDEEFSNFLAIRSTSAYSSPSIPLKSFNLFFTPFVGLLYNNLDNIRLKKQYTTDGQNITYTLNTFYGQYTGNTHLQVQIPYAYIPAPETIMIKHLKIRSFEDYSTNLTTNFLINFQQIQKQFFAINTTTINVDADKQILNIDVQVKCSKGQKILAKFNYCGTCTNHAPYELIRFCYGTNNRIKFLTRFSSTSLFTKVLTIQIASTSLQVYQVAYSDIQKLQINIVSVQIQNM